MSAFFSRASNAGTALRLYLSVQVLAFSVFALFSKKSLSNDVMEWAGGLGFFVTIVMGVLAALALLDCIINDLLPKRFALPTALQHRDLLFSFMAFGYAIHLKWAVHSGLDAEWLAMFYGINVAALVAAAFIDVRSRYKKGTNEPMRSQVIHG